MEMMEIDPVEIKDHATLRQFFSDIAAKNKPGNLQLFFDARVLDSYRKQTGFKIIRTDTSGRISKPGGWSLDFGISGTQNAIIHLAADGFIHRLPETERDHWLDHMMTLPVSENYLKGLIRPGCLDDGDIREW